MNKARVKAKRQSWTIWQKAIIAFLVFSLCCTFSAFFLLIQSNFNLQNILVFPTSAPTNTPTQPPPTQDWRLNPGYVSEKQFGEDWPLTVSEGVIQCPGEGVVIETSNGTFGLTGFTDTLGFTNIKDSGLWKNSDSGGKIPLSRLTSYAVSACR
jgi:hypothetical protein